MKKIYSIAATAVIVATSCFSASAADEGVTLSFNPPLEEELSEFPESFTITVEGPASIKKNIAVGNPVRVKAPGAESWLACNATFSGNVLSLKTHASLDRSIPGEYTVEIAANGITYVWPDETKTKSTLQTYYYKVKGQGGEGPDTPVDDSVKEDLTILSYTPSLSPFDVANKTLETLQMNFNMGGLNVVGEPMVNITGPNYNQTALLKFNMGSFDGKTTNFKANFPSDPVYDGEYTLTIPAGAVGDAAYIADHEKGHTNALIKYKFTVTGGEDPSTIKEDLSFAPSLVTPAPATKVTTLENILLTFDEEVYFNENAQLTVGIKTDQQAMGFSNFCNASLERVPESSRMLKVVFETQATTPAEYQLTIPEGTYWNAALENNEEGASKNGKIAYAWMLVSDEAPFAVLGTTPASGDKVGALTTFVITTSDASKVARATLTVTGYELDNDAAMPVELGTFTTTTIEGNDVVFTLENPLSLLKTHWYELAYVIYDSNDVVIDDNLVEVDGDTQTAINVVESAFGSKVFNMQGVEVKGDVRTLPEGLYIVNGKKVIIK